MLVMLFQVLEESAKFVGHEKVKEKEVAFG
jgi:hypothetical protein